MSACGHTRHVGTCPECQRVQLARWRTQLIAASDATRVSATPRRSSHIEWDGGHRVASRLSVAPTGVSASDLRY